MGTRAQQMIDLGVLAAAAFGLCLVVTPAIRALANRWGLVDNPDGRRKIHKSPIPVAGGVAVYITASLVLMVALWKLPTWWHALGDPEFRWVRLRGLLALDARQFRFACLFAAATVIAIVGVIDDSRGLRGRYKLLGQILAVLIVIFGGVRVDSIRIFGVDVQFGVMAVPFTMFWLLGAINSLNLIDGMDGLLGSVGFIACATIGALAFMNGNFAAACVAVTMAGALLGFLWYNFPPAAIYLGDAGSMLIGLVVGTLSIEASLKGTALALGTVPIALMIVPIVDTSAAIIRRKLTGRSVYTTDRGHLHHVLMSGGLSNHKVLLVVGLMSTLAGAAALVSQWRQNELYAVGAAAGIVIVLVVSRLFGHAEFVLVKEKLFAVIASTRRSRQHGDARQMKVHLQGTANWNELWRDLTSSAETLLLQTLCLDVNAPAIQEDFHARWDRRRRSEDDGTPTGFWRVEIPLSYNHQTIGRLEVIGLRDEDSAWQKLAALAKIVEDVESAIAGMAGKKVAVRPSPASSLRTAEDAHALPIRPAEMPP